MHIQLRDKNPAVVEAWELVFRDDPYIEISQGDIFGYGGKPTRADAIVSPANSFGFMDGGIDAIYSMRWPHLQGDLQEHLHEHYHGELPIGQAVVLPTGDATIPWMISAPTMRVPGNIQGTVNAYLAFRAALEAAMRHNASSNEPILRILSPGMGTAVGQMDPKVSAIQMKFAYKMVIHGEKLNFDDLFQAWDHHEILRRGVL